MRTFRLLTLSPVIAAFLAGSVFAACITVDLDKPGHAASPHLFGIFFEDINCSADGGIYAELVRNRNFEDSERPDHWSVISSGLAEVDLAIDTSRPVSPKNRQSLKVQINKPGAGRVGVANAGFWGMSLVRGQTYDLSLMARAANGFSGPLQISLESGDGIVYASERINSLTPDWKEYRLQLRAKDSDPRTRLVITTKKNGTFFLDMVSLFPRETFNGRPNGLRPDLMNMLADLKPSFVRFPGGCWVEGDTMKEAYRWKQTIGNPAERRTQYNIWQYHATHGLGYHEYLQMCEDLNAEALFVINCGMSHKENVPMDEMGEFVQDALDAIEYANGPVTSTWGAVRAKNGHPAPFNLRMIQIGNENGGTAYNERYALFYDAIKSNYPDLRIIANEWHGRPTSRPIEIVDEHFYNTPEFFINNAGRYDSYDRAGRRVYVGEYAVTRNGGQGNLRAAIGEAAFMTGLERNSDVVVMASYAPLFANVNHKRWNPDLINFDSYRAYGLPGYYVQKLFSEHRSEKILPLTLDTPENQAGPRTGAIGVGTWLTQAEYKDLKAEADGRVLFSSDFSAGTDGWRLRGGNWTTRDGALHQTSLNENVRAFAGDKTWKNYTYTLKARKTGGEEGFLIPFLVQDESAKCWWNIGGWGNRRHAIEMDGIIGDEVNGSIETGRWYDIRIVLSDSRIKCYLDNRLIHDVEFPRMKSLHAVAGLAQGDLVLKVVNSAPTQIDADIKLNGNKSATSGTAILLTSGHPEDENSLDQPTKVAPVTTELNGVGSQFRHSFPGNSLSILRLKLSR